MLVTSVFVASTTIVALLGVITPVPTSVLSASKVTALTLWPETPFVKVTSSGIAEISPPNVIVWSLALTVTSLAAIVQEISFGVTELSDHL